MHRLAFLLLVATLACGRGDQPSSDAAGASGAAAAGASGGAAATTQRGEFVDGDERSEWMLTRRPDGGTSIEDNARFGEDGIANRVFTFDARGTLVRATDQRTQTAQGAGNASPTSVRTELIVDFSGPAPVATKMVDDVRRDVQPYEIDNIRKRADALLQQAGRAAPGTPR